jgi:hypothetical protein
MKCRREVGSRAGAQVGCGRGIEWFHATSAPRGHHGAVGPTRSDTNTAVAMAVAR